MSSSNFTFKTVYTPDTAIKKLKQQAEEIVFNDEKGNVVCDRVFDFLLVNYLMNTLFHNTRGVQVTCGLFDPASFMGWVRVTSKKNIHFSDSKIFMKAVELSTTFELFGRLDGTICAEFGFNNLRNL